MVLAVVLAACSQMPPTGGQHDIRGEAPIGFGTHVLLTGYFSQERIDTPVLMGSVQGGQFVIPLSAPLYLNTYDFCESGQMVTAAGGFNFVLTFKPDSRDISDMLVYLRLENDDVAVAWFYSVTPIRYTGPCGPNSAVDVNLQSGWNTVLLDANNNVVSAPTPADVTWRVHNFSTP